MHVRYLRCDCYSPSADQPAASRSATVTRPHRCCTLAWSSPPDVAIQTTVQVVPAGMRIKRCIACLQVRSHAQKWFIKCRTRAGRILSARLGGLGQLAAGRRAGRRHAGDDDAAARGGIQPARLRLGGVSGCTVSWRGARPMQCLLRQCCISTFQAMSVRLHDAYIWLTIRHTLNRAVACSRMQPAPSTLGCLRNSPSSARRVF
jgi:hypothetical protein